jgi:hypothetical protein
MSNQEYANKLIGGIGRVKLAMNVSNAFPLVGETVSLEATTKWAQKMYFTKRSTSDPSVMTGETIDNTSQKTSVTIPVSGSGDLRQDVRAVNYRNAEELFSTSLIRYLYAMQPQSLPYHEIRASSEISRTDQSFDLLISGDNGYDTSRERIVQVYILKENGSVDNPADVVSARTAPDYTNDNGELVFSQYSIPTRGIYDVETRYYDTLTQKTISKRINKLITITPRLAAKPSEGQEPKMSIVSVGYPDAKIDVYETGVNDCYMVFNIPDTSYYRDINIDSLPSGYDAYTLVLKKSVENGSSRIRIACTEIKGNPQQNPSPQFSEERPLVVTIDQDTPLTLYGTSWNTMSFISMWHVVVDGRGYYNVSKGIKLDRNPDRSITPPVIHIQITDGTKYIEFFEMEIIRCSFAGVSIKTDPTTSNPWYWYENFELTNLWLHHMYVHDPDSEGWYIGYFTPEKSTVTYTGETVTFKNLKGEDVTYTKGKAYTKKAHYLTNFRFYRNTTERTGYDGVQISNTVGEVCYNTLVDCAYKEEASQASGLSIQSFAGKCYNNFLLDSHGANMQIGPIGNIDIFNNVVQSKYGNGVQFLFSYDTPEQNPTGASAGSGVINDDLQVIFRNNVISIPGLTANGRNTVQVRGIHMYDNITANNGQLFANMTKDTLAAWESQAVNNEVFLYSDLYQKAIDLKIADYISGDYRVAFDSPLINAGLGDGFTFDYRGYLNWYTTACPIGPFMGKFKSDDIDDDAVVLLFILINDGDTSTHQRNVNILFNYTGAATRYRISETADLSSATWQNIPEENMVEYTLSDGFGQKTIYVQISKGQTTSDVKSATIEYVSTPLTLEALILNEGKITSTSLIIPVTFTYSGSFAPTKYRLGEVADLTGVSWMDYSDSVNYTFASIGSKTVYGQLQDAEGNETEIKHSSITIEEPSEKIVISTGWINSEIGSTGSLYDEINKLVKISTPAVNTTRNLYTVTGDSLGTLTKIDSEGASYMLASTKGASTGDNSGIYPDEILEHNICTGGNSEKYRENKIEGLSAAIYKIRLFCSTIHANVDVSRSIWKVSVDGVETDFLIPVGFTPKDNLTQWLERTVEIGENGFSILWGVTSAGAFINVPLNVIEIEQV